MADKSHAFEKGDSNRCRHVYELILRAFLPPHVLDAQKKNKHVSVGRCRMLAINHSVALPTYEALSRAGFDTARVLREDWGVPTDCKRFEKMRAEEGLCGGQCTRCDQTSASALEACRRLPLLCKPADAAQGSEAETGRAPQAETEREVAVPSRVGGGGGGSGGGGAGGGDGRGGGGIRGWVSPTAPLTSDQSRQLAQAVIAKRATAPPPLTSEEAARLAQAEGAVGLSLLGAAALFTCAAGMASSSMPPPPPLTLATRKRKG